MTPAAEIDVAPRCQSIRGGGGRKADIGKVTGAIARRDVQATTKSDGEMRIVTANAPALSVCLQCSSGCAGMFVTEGEVAAAKVADRLSPGPSRGRTAE